MGLGVSNNNFHWWFNQRICRLIINRKEAWRTDGGTAIFGGGALALSLVSIALNLYQVSIKLVTGIFSYIPKIVKVPPVWIPPLLWAVVLWQSFLGWWWYVGSATPEPHPRMHSKGKKRNKARNGEAARLAKVRNRLGLSDGLRKRRPGGDGDSSTELNRTSSERESAIIQSPRAATRSPIPPPRTTWLSGYLPSSIVTWWHRLRLEHVNAREQQAAENEQRRFEVYGHIDESGVHTVRGVPGSGWGLGSFALAGRRRAAEVSRPGTDDERGVDGEVEAAYEMGNMGPTSPWGDDEGQRVPQRPKQQLRPAGREELSGPIRSWSWMGPFQRWRLRDATVY